MDWFATFVGTMMIAVGSLEYFAPGIMDRWDTAVGRGPSSPSLHKLLGGIGIVSGIVIILLFNYLSLSK